MALKTEKYVNFYTDFAFKRLFGSEINKELLMGFLNALLSEEQPIKDIQYLNSESVGNLEGDRRVYFDVLCINERGERFIVEMQQAEQHFFKDRALFYAARAIQQQAVKGIWDFHLNKVYTICILNFSFDKKNEKFYHHDVVLMEKNTKEVFYDKLEFIYLEMPKFNKKENELETLTDKWLYAIKNIAKLDTRPDSLQEKIFQRFFEAAEIAKFTRNEQHLYVESRKDRWDYENTMQYKYKEGKIEGKTEGKIEDAKGFKEHGVDIAVISAVTGLSIEEIEKL